MSSGVTKEAGSNESSGSVLCFRCGKAIPENNLGRQDSCTSCGADTRCCRNCRHYDPAYNNQCREEQAPRQVEKEKGNFCEWFQPRVGAVSGGPAPSSAKAAAEALFGKKGAAFAPAPGNDAKTAAENLFKKKS